MWKFDSGTGILEALEAKRGRNIQVTARRILSRGSVGNMSETRVSRYRDNQSDWLEPSENQYEYVHLTVDFRLKRQEGP